MDTHHSNPTSATQHDPTAQPTDPVALARGLFAAALERCEDGSDWGLEVCQAWEELDEPGRLPDIVDVDVPPLVRPEAILQQARRVLREAIPTIQPGLRAVALGLSIRRIDAALRTLDRESSCDGPAWP